MNHYKAFNLTFGSQLPLPDFQEIEAGTPDVEIRYGDVAEHLLDPLVKQGVFEGKSGELLLTIPGVARYLIVAPGRVTIDRSLGGTDEDIKTFLIGSGIGALLHMRGKLLLHASTVVVDGKSVLFGGRSGDGKSTIAAAFSRKGYHVLSDDLSVLDTNDDGETVVYPSFPRFRLWQNSARHLGYDIDGGRLLTDRLKGKYVLPSQTFSSDAFPIGAIYRIHAIKNESPRITSLTYMQQFNELITFTYRKAFVKALGTRLSHFKKAEELLAKVPVKSLGRSNGKLDTDALVDAVLKDLKSTETGRHACPK